MSKSKPSVISPEREEEIVQIWLGFILSGTLVVKDGDDVEWSNLDSPEIKKAITLHEKISKELDDRQHPAFARGWAEVFRRYNSLPLIEALS